jgi:hypothetical protein
VRAQALAQQRVQVFAERRTCASSLVAITRCTASAAAQATGWPR